LFGSFGAQAAQVGPGQDRQHSPVVVSRVAALAPWGRQAGMLHQADLVAEGLKVMEF
jgi:hypothetical protein